IARAFSEKATPHIGKPFVFEYRSGASTTIGTASVARTEPDGYTILSLPSAGVGAAAIRSKLSYNIETDFAPIAGTGSIPLVLVVRAGLNISDIAGFSAAVRSGKLAVGSAGVGTIGHLSSLLLMSEIKGTATHVPFRGNPETFQNLIGGHVDFSMLSAADAIAHVDSKAVKLLATTADRRLIDLPNVPTMAEVGLSNVNTKLWYSFVAPSKTPADRIKRLYHSFVEAGKSLSADSSIQKLGYVVEMRDPDQTAKMISQELAGWKKLIELNNIPLEN
ncbi:MAG TPA: tripartite tricarboxylate transporter substrate binding protein, partial [Nitrospiraceae bacterium]|nr:tripartite tricarboxylate transporter substrate binding protein [Nitrospiraceae bacterium]